MRVGFLTYGLDRAPTGIGRYAVQLLHALTSIPNGPEIVVLATERQDRFGLSNLFEYHALPGCQLLPSLLTVGNLALTWAASRYRLDVVHDPNGIAPFLGPSGGARRVVTIHDAFAYVCPDQHNWLDNWRYRWLLPQASHRADMVITVSECSRRDLIRYLGISPAKVRTTQEGVDARFRAVADSAERRAVLARYQIDSSYLLYIGGLNARKNVARLLEAYALVRRLHPNVLLVIGGKRQWQTAEIEQTFRRLNLDDHVHFTGYLDDADLPALYSAAEGFVFPSLYEGFGLPPLEAMACGTPVVTSNASSLPEVVGDAALTVDPGDVEGLAAAIHRVLTDDPLRANLRQRGLMRAAQFRWERTARETLAIYEQTLHRAVEPAVAAVQPGIEGRGHES